MYCINLQRALHGSSCSSTVIKTFGMYAFWQFSTKGIHMEDTTQNLSCFKFVILSLFKSKRRYLIISRNLLRGIVLLNNGQPQTLSRMPLIGEFLPPIAPRAIIKPINFSKSFKLIVQLGFFVTRCASASVHFCMFLNIGSLINIRKDEGGSLRFTQDTEYAVGPGRIFTAFCFCIRP